MKRIALLILIFTSYLTVAQEKMTTNNGIIHFEASVPFFEEVKATNEKTSCVLDTKTNALTFVVFISDFLFKRELMHTHFNENYMESDHFPRATFKGKIAKFDPKIVNPNAVEYLIKGKINIHGKAKNIEVKAMLKKIDENIELVSDFDLNTDDFAIDIPMMVRSKISKNVNVKIDCILK